MLSAKNPLKQGLSAVSTLDMPGSVPASATACWGKIWLILSFYKTHYKS